MLKIIWDVLAHSLVDGFVLRWSGPLWGTADAIAQVGVPKSRRCRKIGNVNAGGQAGGRLMVGKVVNQTVRQRVKESANWRCQNPNCQRACLRPGETLAELLSRQRQEAGCEGQLELDLRSRADASQPYIMKAVPDGYGGYLALCGSCAIQFVQPSPQPCFQQTKLELLGQLRLL